MSEQLHRYVQQLVEMPAETWAEFINLFSGAKLKKGEHFIEAGKKEKKVGFLLSGITRTYFCDRNGREYTKNFHGAGSFIGAYTSVVTGHVNLINVQALKDCRLLVADYREMESLFDAHHMLERLARKLAEHYFVHKEKRELELAMLPAEERYRIFQKEFPGLENEIPQYHIASYLGITPTQLSRIRAAWI